MILLIPAAVLALCGWLIKYRKMTWLISGYNMASKKKKEQYDVDKLCRYTGSLVFILAGIFFVFAVLIELFEPYFEDIALTCLVSILAASLAGIIFLNAGGKAKKNR